MSRKTARDYAYKLVFEYLFTNDCESVTRDIFLNDSTLSEKDKTYIVDAFNGVVEHFDEIQTVIASFAKGFSLERMFKPDLAILYLAIFEMKYMKDIPLTVSISEAVEIVKSYSTEKSNSFVNGILANVYKELEGTK